MDRQTKLDKEIEINILAKKLEETYYEKFKEILANAKNATSCSDLDFIAKYGDDIRAFWEKLPSMTKEKEITEEVRLFMEYCKFIGAYDPKIEEY